MAFRDVYGQVMSDLMEKDEKIVVLDADLARCNGTAKLHEKYPDRALDIGIAEANMASMAAGMASAGLKPWISSFAPFATRRIADQIAISIAYAKQNVKIIGTDPGISAELNGGTHMSLEDVGILRSIPTTVIFEPIDEVMLAKAIPVINDYNGMVYIRMFRKDQPIYTKEDYQFDLFKADILAEGKDVTIFATGIMVDTAMKAREILLSKGIDAEVINIHTIKPIDEQTVLESIKKTRAAVVAENHNIHCGLYSAVTEVICANDPVPVTPVAIPNCFGEVGKMPYLREKFHLTVDDIVEACLKSVGMKK